MQSGDKAPTRFVVLGGYLGAGKTTLAAALGNELRSKHGRSVAIITNDQGNVLVDTEYMKNAGFDVKDVLGGCFCANFGEFVKNARTLVAMGRPDVIIAEPIGTSTAILGSVVSPLRSMYPDEFQVAPFFVIVDGTRAAETLRKPEGFGLGGGKLIPSHQVREAEYVLISKVDRLNEGEVASASDLIRKEVSDAEVIPCSAFSRKNLDRIVDIILSDQVSTKEPKDVDQRMFAVEKASMGWFNAHARLVAEGRVDINAFVSSLMRRVATEFAPETIGHVKVMLTSSTASAKMSLVEDRMQVDGLKGGRYFTGEGKIVLNARVSASPNELKKVFEKAIYDTALEAGAKVEEMGEACFSPKPEAPSLFVK
ncbi:MAG TPA: GTP-binding protein [Methanomassiliicoccales archaeon]|nr:GTP-binding protein [Methanomassiliicoccales archaeon]HPR98161.1 GTP-binding protein [Methanomassiliicoccales archaeon]